MSGFMDAIGLVSGILGIIDFGLSHFPAEEEASGATVRIGVGLADPGGGPVTQGGTVFSIYGYDANNVFIGQSDTNVDIQDGEFSDFTIHQEGNEETESRFIDVGVSDDDICMQYTSVTQPNGVLRTVLGDTCMHCGQPSYFANVDIGTHKDGTPYKGNCCWLDSDHTNGTPSGGFKANLDKFQADLENYHPQTDFVCADAYVAFTPGYQPSGAKKAKRGSTWRKRSANLDGRLIKSHDIHQSATELCERPMSHGPDFLDVHGFFCDMDQKQVFPVCGGPHDGPGCVEVNTANRTIGHRLDDPVRLGKRDRFFMDKIYQRYTEWH